MVNDLIKIGCGEQELLRAVIYNVLQKMKILRLLMLCSLALLCACSKEDSTEATVDRHVEAIEEYQKGQQLFKDTVATVRDETSYDKAVPDLEQVIQRVRRAAVLMRDLIPPEEAARARYSQMIVDGNRRTEPTGEDMMSMLTIESREDEVVAWMEAFGVSVQEVGDEMKRLYGEIDYARGMGKPIQLDRQAEQNEPANPLHAPESDSK